jgi:hypothetical protein
VSFLKHHYSKTKKTKNKISTQKCAPDIAKLKKMNIF